MTLTEIYDIHKDYSFSLSAYKKKVIQYAVSIIFAVIILLIFVYLLKEVPHHEVAHFGITDPKDLAEMENSYRATLVQTLGGIAIGIGLYYTWRRVTIAENELKISKQGQITERFTRAVDQLGAIDIKGDPAIEIRLGGIYALERISKESDEDYWPIIEILTAYVRKNSPAKEELKGNNQPNEFISIDNKENTRSKVLEVRKLSLDIEAIATIIGRRKNNFKKGEPKPLNLEEVCFQGANLSRANLREADLSEANLSRANLREADLSGADLSRANLLGVDFSMAYLTRAKLSGTDLSRAKLSGANLSGANLSGAYFLGANLLGANLLGANLSGANLSGAYLSGVDLSEAYLSGADLSRANLSEADLTGANLSEADLSETNNLIIDQLSKVKTLYKAKLDEDLRKQLEDKYPDEYRNLTKKSDYTVTIK